MLEYNFLIVDDIPEVIKTHENLIKLAIADEVFDGFLREKTGVSDVIGGITTACNAYEAVARVSENYQKNPDLIQIVLSDYKMPDAWANGNGVKVNGDDRVSVEKKALLDLAAGKTDSIGRIVTGTELTDYLRWSYPQNKLGQLILTAYADNENVKTSRQKGVFETLSKPVMFEELVDSSLKVFEMILLKDKPFKKDVEGVFNFKLLETPEEILEMVQLRYKVWSKLNYIPPDRLSHKAGIEVDEYDACSIPLGGFAIINGKKKLVTTSRIITLEKQPFYEKLFSQVVDEFGDDIIKGSYYREREKPLIIFENYESKVNQFLSTFPHNINYCEYSRLMNNPSYRGMDLSIKIIQFLNMYSKFYLNMDVSFVECSVGHSKMNLEKNKFTGIIPNVSIINEKRVQNISLGLYVNLDDFSNKEANLYSTEIHSIFGKFSQDSSFCYCNNHCISNNYCYQNSEICPKNR